MATTGIKSPTMFRSEEGDSFYSRNNPMSFEVYSSLYEDTKENVHNCLQKLALGNKVQTVQIADFGTADGRGFFNVVPLYIDAVKQAFSRDVGVKLLLNDRPENDFTAVRNNFLNVVSREESSHKLHDVSFATVGKSFYSQCFDDDSVSIALCLTAVHWLSLRPTLMKELWEVLAPPSKQAAFRAQAELDWECFLVSRARELVKGGMLLVSTVGKKDDGTVCEGFWNTHELMVQCWEDFEIRGIITKSEQEKATFPIYTRTKADLIKPFADKESKVCKLGLQLRDITTKIVPSPIYQEFMASKKETGDCNKFAKKLVQLIKSVVYNMHYMALDDHRTDEEKKLICDEFFSIMETEAAKEPHKYSFEYIMQQVFVVKVNQKKH